MWPWDDRKSMEVSINGYPKNAGWFSNDGTSFNEINTGLIWIDNIGVYEINYSNKPSSHIPSSFSWINTPILILG